MAKKQTRRSVSIRGTTYEKIRDYCAKMGLSMSEFVEMRIAEFIENDKKRSNTGARSTEAAVASVAVLSSRRSPKRVSTPAPKAEYATTDYSPTKRPRASVRRTEIAKARSPRGRRPTQAANRIRSNAEASVATREGGAERKIAPLDVYIESRTFTF